MRFFNHFHHALFHRFFPIFSLCSFCSILVSIFISPGEIMSNKWINLVLWVLVFQLIAAIIAVITHSSTALWYGTLIRSPLSPPKTVFTIVWTILYTMIAVAGWSLWQNRHEYRAKSAFVFYCIQLLMNWSWTPLFFLYHLLQLSYLWVIGMAILTFITIMIT